MQPSALFILALFVLLGARNGAGSMGQGALFALMVFGSILVHELGHAFLGRANGLGHIDITLHGFGGFTRFERPPAPRQGLVVTFAGPAASLLLGVVALVASWFLGPGLPDLLATNAARINLFWGVFNLLPMYPLDGGLLTWHGLSLVIPRARALQWAARVGVLVAVAVGTYAVVFQEIFIGIIALMSLAQTVPLAIERERH